MLYIIVRDTNSGHTSGEREFSWHVGKPRPIIEEEVIEVQADGDELAYIIGSFVNLPRPVEKSVMRWYGDHAKLIAHNL